MPAHNMSHKLREVTNFSRRRDADATRSAFVASASPPTIGTT